MKYIAFLLLLILYPQQGYTKAMCPAGKTQAECCAMDSTGATYTSQADCLSNCSGGTCSAGYYAGCYKCTRALSPTQTLCTGRTPVKSTQSDGSIKCSCNSTSCGTGATCVRHPSYNALTLAYNYSYCVCQTGYYDNGSGCNACPTGCSSCSSASVCTACSSGYTLSGGKCISDTVSSCPSGTTLSSDGCCCLND